MFGLCVGELIHNGTTFSLLEGCRKIWEGSQQKDGIQNHSRGERSQANNRSERLKVKASEAENKALAQAKGWEPRECQEPDGFRAQ